MGPVILPPKKNQKNNGLQETQICLNCNEGEREVPGENGVIWCFSDHESEHEPEQGGDNGDSSDNISGPVGPGIPPEQNEDYMIFLMNLIIQIF